MSSYKEYSRLRDAIVCDGSDFPLDELDLFDLAADAGLMDNFGDSLDDYIDYDIDNDLLH
jgi:hypothetical protein